MDPTRDRFPKFVLGEITLKTGDGEEGVTAADHFTSEGSGKQKLRIEVSLGGSKNVCKPVVANDNVEYVATTIQLTK